MIGELVKRYLECYERYKKAVDFFNSDAPNKEKYYSNYLDLLAEWNAIGNEIQKIDKQQWNQYINKLKKGVAYV
jgi:hypothetical protein